MASVLLGRRERVLARHDRALERWPDRSGGFSAELIQVTNELEAIAIALDTQGSTSIERCRTWRFLGDALFDLAHGTDASVLSRAVAAYDKAEALLAVLDEPLDRAKLDFNFANTLRGMSGGSDRALLEEAQLRYRLAIAGFASHAPQHVPTVQRTLDTLLPQLKMLDALDRARAGLESLTRAAQALARSPNDAAVQRDARQVLKTMQKQRNGVLAEAVAAVEEFGGTQPEGVADRLTSIINHLQNSAGDDADPFQRMLPKLLARFRSEIAAGRIAPQRRAALEPILDELHALIHEPEGGIDASVDRLGKLRQLMMRMTELLGQPSTGLAPPPAGSRAERVAHWEDALSKHLGAEQARANLGPGERETGRKIHEDLARARSMLAKVAVDESQANAHERDLLRPLARRVEQFALRHHITLATPMWARALQPPDPSGVYLCGASRCEPLLDAVADTRALRRVRPASQTEAGQERWNAIAASRLVVCDLRLPQGPALAAACYEIGLAKSLGRALVIVKAPDTVVPFDIEVAAVDLQGGQPDRAALADAIDAALYEPPHREDNSSLAATIAELERRYSTVSTFEVRKSLDLVRQAATDAIEARGRIESLIGFAGPQAPRLIFPAWPGAYPVAGERRLFHVMPFSLPWSNNVRDAVAAACDRHRVRYVRGDEVPDPRVIRSIWAEICRASHVLVDLTAFNANVALELGLVHGLGRNTLVVGQDDTVQMLFPAIRKLRVLPYPLAGGSGTLADAVERFIESEAAVSE